MEGMSASLLALTVTNSIDSIARITLVMFGEGLYVTSFLGKIITERGIFFSEKQLKREL